MSDKTLGKESPKKEYKFSPESSVIYQLMIKNIQREPFTTTLSIYNDNSVQFNRREIPLDDLKELDINSVSFEELIFFCNQHKFQLNDPESITEEYQHPGKHRKRRLLPLNNFEKKVAWNNIKFFPVDKIKDQTNLMSLVVLKMIETKNTDLEEFLKSFNMDPKKMTQHFLFGLKYLVSEDFFKGYLSQRYQSEEIGEIYKTCVDLFIKWEEYKLKNKIGDSNFFYPFPLSIRKEHFNSAGWKKNIMPAISFLPFLKDLVFRYLTEYSFLQNYDTASNAIASFLGLVENLNPLPFDVSESIEYFKSNIDEILKNYNYAEINERNKSRMTIQEALILLSLFSAKYNNAGSVERKNFFKDTHMAVEKLGKEYTFQLLLNSLGSKYNLT